MKQEIIDLVSSQKTFDRASLLAFIEVETGGKGFDSLTQKLIIQFEPSWFRKKEPYAPSGAWSVNKVDRQREEWVAFNNAFKISPNSAMESTSIGLGQIMGFHWKRLGYKNVGEMWDDAKKGLHEQLNQLLRFIITDINLLKAIKEKDWHVVATIYNGSKYKQMAERLGREPYDVSLSRAYERYVVTLNS